MDCDKWLWKTKKWQWLKDLKKKKSEKIIGQFTWHRTLKKKTLSNVEHLSWQNGVCSLIVKCSIHHKPTTPLTHDCNDLIMFSIMIERKKYVTFIRV